MASWRRANRVDGRRPGALGDGERDGSDEEARHDHVEHVEQRLATHLHRVRDVCIRRRLTCSGSSRQVERGVGSRATPRTPRVRDVRIWFSAARVEDDVAVDVHTNQRPLAVRYVVGHVSVLADF